MIKDASCLKQEGLQKSTIISQAKVSQIFANLIEDQSSKQFNNYFPTNIQLLKRSNSPNNLKISQNFSCTSMKKSTSNIESLLKKLHDEQDSSQPISPSYKFLRAKSQNFLTKQMVPMLVMEKQKQKIEQPQSKTPYLLNQQKLTKVKSMGSNLVLSKSIEKIVTINQKTQQCKQLCCDIKRKLFKETVSTTATNAFKQSKCLSPKDFKLGQRIGKGKFSKVYIARHILTGMIVAIKIIKKQTIKNENFIEQILRQIKIQTFFTHPNIIKLYAFFHDSINVYLVLQYCCGGQLYDIFKTKNKLKEQDWAPIMKGICEGILQLHTQNVIHRDIKPQNVVMSFGMPKLGDFGWSVHNSDFKRQTFCGTPLYISPQLLIGSNYGKQVDVWALGVMMYQFLTGKIPFKIENEENELQIVNSKIVYPKYMSLDCLNILNSILQKDPQSRIGVKNILKHPFLTKKTSRVNINFKINKPE